MEFLYSHANGIDALGRVSTKDPGWTTPMRGLRIPGALPLTHRLLTEAAIAGAGRLAVACDLTAAHIWSVAVPSGFGLEVDAQACAVATIRDGSRLRQGGVRGRRLELPATHVTHVNGLAITTPARTWLDCAQLISYADTVAMGDGTLAAGLATLAELEEMVAWGRGRRGVRFARMALAVLDGASESPGESWVRAHLVRAGVPRPICNPTVRVGRWAFRLDMAWPDRMVAVEYDGDEYHGPDQAAHDAWRRQLLRQRGWIVIVVRKEDLADLPRLVAEVQLALLRPVTARTSSDRSR
jgi:hypothetical protein